MKRMTFHLSILFFLSLFSASAAADDLPGSPKVTPKLHEWIAAHPQDDTVKAWVYFHDKGISDPDELAAALAARQKELSPRALWRRSKVNPGALVDLRDLPVHAAYREQVTDLSRKHRADSRVLNAVSVETTIRDLDRIAALDCVARLDLVVAFERSDVAVRSQLPLVRTGKGSRSLDYGYSWTQLDQINVPSVHDTGFNGDGVIVCMLDTGFYKDHEAVAGLDLIGEWDFINDDGNTQNEGGDDPYQHYHGTYTWSALGGMKDGIMYGPAYGASFLLAKTEDVTQEVPIEEDWWTEGIEWAEANGADMASSSLGYTDWYSYSDMDGQTAVTTIAANWATEKGVVVVTAMGNNGWYAGALIVPSDSDGAVSCGAVDEFGSLASFSSTGPTYDGRIKPNVCAMGVYTFCAVASGTSDYGWANGTSLSTPLVGGSVALLLEAHPDWTPADIQEALQQTASQSSSPDNYYGWGVLDCLGALNCTGLSLLETDLSQLSGNTGGQVNFTLNGGAHNANLPYTLLGSLSGTEPGTPLPGGLVTLPLNRDWFFNYVLTHLNTSMFTDFQGTFDAAGEANAQLNAPPVPTYIGSTGQFAYVVGPPWSEASNAVAIEIVP